MSSNLLEGFFEAAKSALSTIPFEERPDIYSISFLVYDDQDDPRLPTLTIGTNTVSYWQESIREASSPAEAKWNYAFWRQDQLALLGEPGSPSATTISEWITSLGLYYTDEEQDADFERCIVIDEKITSQFVEMACRLARALHSEGVVEAIFGSSIPILIHELEYYEEIADQTEAANPPGVARDFINWVRSDDC